MNRTNIRATAYSLSAFGAACSCPRVEVSGAGGRRRRLELLEEVRESTRAWQTARIREVMAKEQAAREEKEREGLD
jgi:hypothetical protein